MKGLVAHINSQHIQSKRGSEEYPCFWKVSKKTHHKILSCDCSLHPTNGIPVRQNACSSMVDKKREPQKKESKKGKRRKKQKVENNQDGHGHAR